MRIDVHAHYWTGGYLDLLAGLGQAGVEMQVLSAGSGNGAQKHSS